VKKENTMRNVSIGGKCCIAAITLSLMALVGVVASPVATARPRVHTAATHKQKNTDPVIYNSIDSPLPGNNASQSFEATQTSEFGNQIAFAGSARVLADVVATLSSWGCQSGNQGTANIGTISSPTPGSCVTTPGSTFSEPVTLNIYGVGANNAVGALIATDTQTFDIPFRPSALPDTGSCSATGSSDGTAWYDPVTSKCVHGYFTNITFSFGHVALPNKVIYGIAYNTSDYGFQPYGDATTCHSTTAGCGYDSLNVGYSTEPFQPSIGSDPNLGTDYLDGSYAPFYCDDGAGGTGTFRIDGRPDTDNCWNGGGYNTGYSYYGIEDGGPVPAGQVSPYVVPSVQFNAVNSPAATITSANNATVVAGTPFSFSVTTTGIPTPTISERGRLPHGLRFTTDGSGTATITGTALTSNRNRVYKLTLRAANLPTGGRNRQQFNLTLTGGRR
jgi:hypothetical protein